MTYVATVDFCGTVSCMPTAPPRDLFVDFIRALSLVIVVTWHWVFTILYIADDQTLQATSILQFSYGFWPLTWIFQVMPLFFFVGGFLHMKGWQKTLASSPSYGEAYRSFVKSRLSRLAIPSLALIAGWMFLGLVASLLLGQRDLVTSSVILVISPLWFIAVYLTLVVLAPLMHSLHERFGPLVLVFLVAAAAVCDTFRFTANIAWPAALNMLFVWCACHQLGFFYPFLVKAPKTWLYSFVFGGLFTLLLLISTGAYPASMVGVPGDTISNMAPPTLAIVAVCFLQVGTALLLRPWLTRLLNTPGRFSNFSGRVNQVAMPLFLFHTSGLAVELILLYEVFHWTPPASPSSFWWLTRPLIALGALAATLPIMSFFGSRLGLNNHSSRDGKVLRKGKTRDA